MDGTKESRGIKLGGLLSSQRIENIIQEAANLKGINNIKDIKMPISIITTDLIQDRKMVFTNNEELTEDYYIKDIEIGKAVRASSTFPVVYSPFEYKKYQFVDGGIFDNLPSAEARKLGVDKVLAIRFKITTPRKQNTMYNIAMKSLDLMIENLIKDSIKSSDYVLEIDLKDVKVFNINKLNFAYNEGYKETLKDIRKIKEVLQ